ncbi:MAG: PEP-CTERM sorting domain-containing protein [Planctomycetota bacterium]
MSSASAAVTFVENFEGFDLSGPDPVLWASGDWTEFGSSGFNISHTVIVDATDPTNQVGVAADAGEDYFISSPVVPDNSVATFAFDVAALDLLGDVNIGFGDSTDASPNNGNLAGAIRFVNGDIQTFAGPGNSPSTGFSYAANTGYTIWTVVDTTADQYDVFILGGAFATQTQIANDVAITGTAAGTNSLPFLLVRPNNGNSDSAGLVLDNLAVDVGNVNLTAFNVPEPGSMGLLGLGLTALMARRRCDDK